MAAGVHLYETGSRALGFSKRQRALSGLVGLPRGPEWEAFDWNHFAVVKGFRAWPGLHFPVIRHSTVDYMATTRDAVIAQVYRQIAALLYRSTVPDDDVARLGSLLGYAQMYTEVELEAGWQMLDEARKTKLPAETVRWLEKCRPDVVIGFPSSLFHAVLEAGFRIPQDFAFARVLDYEAFSKTFGVATCDSRGEIFPRGAVQLLHRMIQLGDRGQISEPVETVVEPHWLEARACRCVETVLPIKASHRHSGSPIVDATKDVQRWGNGIFR